MPIMQSLTKKVTIEKIMVQKVPIEVVDPPEETTVITMLLPVEVTEIRNKY